MNISKTGFKRLWRLVEHMRSLPASANKHFDMLDYINHAAKDHKHKIPLKPTVKDLHACGTTACALGWAMTVPSLRRAGLKFRVEKGYFDPNLSWYEVVGSDEVFDIDIYEHEAEWEELFGADNRDKTPKQWAKRVSVILRKWQREQAKA